MNRWLGVSLTAMVFSLIAPGQTVSLLNSSIDTPPNGLINVIVKAGSIPAGEVKKDSMRTTPLVLSDLTPSPRGTLTAVGGGSEYLGASGQNAYWRTTWKVSGLRIGATEVHLLKLELGKAVSITQLTLRGPADLQVSLSGPGIPLRLNRSHCVEILISSNGFLSKVKPIQSTLVDDKTGQPIPQSSLYLVDNANNSSASTAGLGIANPLQPLCLQVAENFSSPGKFDGNVTLGSTEKPDLGNFHVTVYFTSWTYRFYGIGCLFLGLVAYFVVAVWSKARSRWILALLPAARLRDEVTQLLQITESAATSTEYNFPVLLADNANPGSLRNLLGQLSRQNLANKGLPWQFAIPFAVPDLSSQYQSFLLATGNQVASVGLIVRWGVVNVVAMWPQVRTLHLQQAGNTALQILEQLAVGVGPPGQLNAQIQQALTTLQAAIQAAQAAAGGHAVGGAPRVTYGIPTPQQLTVQLEQLSVFIWILWAVLTIGVGACALVVFNDGFGTTADLIQCFLWGAGMPAVGQGLGGLSAGSVTSAFSLQTAR